MQPGQDNYKSNLTIRQKEEFKEYYNAEYFSSKWNIL